MQILPINTTPYQRKQPTFGNSARTVYDASSQLMYKTNTYFFRSDFDWAKLSQFLEHKFGNADKITIIDHACSSGEEACTLATLLIDKLGEKAEKYLPIIARDCDEENISTAKIYKLALDSTEKLEFTRNIRNISKYGNYVDRYFRPNNTIRRNIQFSCGNILEDVDNMPSHNTVLFCRNMWPYLRPEDRNLLVDKIDKKFDDTCYIAIGYYDTIKSDVQKLFYEHGFTETPVMHLYGRNK